MNKNHLPIRVWAALIRDRVAPYESVTDEQAVMARTVCNLLDMLDRFQAASLKNSVRMTIAMLVGKLALAGLATKEPTTWFT
jgi:hypothetical protein